MQIKNWVNLIILIIIYWHIHIIMYMHDCTVARSCIALRMKLETSDGNSSMDSSLCRCVKDWPLSTAFDSLMPLASLCFARFGECFTIGL